MNKQFRHEFQQLIESGFVESNCNAITFINKSDANAMVENFVLEPGDSLQLEGWPGETDRTNYRVYIDNTATVKRVDVIRKLYK